MSAASMLRELGAVPEISLSGGQKLSGLSSLDQKTASSVLGLAKDHKAEILAELRGQPLKNRKPYASHKMNTKANTLARPSGLAWVQDPKGDLSDSWGAAWYLRGLAEDYGLWLERLEDGSFCLNGADRPDEPDLLPLAVEWLRQARPYLEQHLAKGGN